MEKQAFQSFSSTRSRDFKSYFKELEKKKEKKATALLSPRVLRNNYLTEATYMSVAAGLLENSGAEGNRLSF